MQDRLQRLAHRPDQCPPATTAKYAYQADYLDLQLPENIQYVNTMCTAGTTIFLTAYVQGDEIVQTDPDTGDTWSYYTQELTFCLSTPIPARAPSFPTCSCPRFPRTARATLTATTWQAPTTARSGCS